MNIYQKMSAVTEEINKVAKNLKIGVGQNSYRAVGESDVLESVKPIEIKYGIYSYPANRKIVTEDIFETETVYNEKTTKRTNIFMRLETTYRFVNIEQPDEFIDIITYGDGVDVQDKAPGKAMTYSDKYALLKAYKIETGDDPDQKASEPMKIKVFKQPTDEQLRRLTELGGSKSIVANYYHVDENRVTAEMIQNMINAKEQKLKTQSKSEIIKNKKEGDLGYDNKGAKYI